MVLGSWSICLAGGFIQVGIYKLLLWFFDHFRFIYSYFMGTCCNIKRNTPLILEPEANNLLIKLKSSLGPKTTHSLQVDFPYSHCNLLVWTGTEPEFSTIFTSPYYKVQVTLDFSMTFNATSYYSFSSNTPLSIDSLIFYINTNIDLEIVKILIKKHSNIPIKIIITDLKMTSLENVAIIPKGEIYTLWSHLFIQQSNLERMLREIFDDFDKDHNNEINNEEFYESLQRLDPRLTQADTNKIFQSIDMDSDGRVSFNEFSFWWKRGRQLKTSVVEMTMELADRISYFLPKMLKVDKKIGVNRRKLYKKLRILLSPCSGFSSSPQFFFKLFVGKSAKREQLLRQAEDILSLNIHEFWVSIKLTAKSQETLMKRLQLVENMLYYLKHSWLNNSFPSLPDLASTRVQVNKSDIWISICFNFNNESVSSLTEQLKNMEKQFISPIDDYFSLTVNSGTPLKEILKQQKKHFFQLFEKGSIEIEAEHWAGFSKLGQNNSGFNHAVQKFLQIEGEQVLDKVESEPFLPLLDYLKSGIGLYRELVGYIPIIGEALSVDPESFEEKMSVFLRFSNIGGEVQIAGQDLNYFINNL